ncbi:MFS general substrate transporter [Hesseltinella vesiculosa]|uniref:MFS general substrate transporter n=1 Tax=Hesseltinella vesiculosa TaxID=101127 RepID=A0A1X2GWX7_9FUNG|nr:MFS general substrate transporter [Hesseltinella vesiculosa]
MEEVKIDAEAIQSSQPVKTSTMAWVALFFLVVLRSAVSIFNNTFSPIPTVTATYLNVDLSAINWLFNSQAIVYIVVSFGTSWLFEKCGVKLSLLLACATITIGCWIRWVAVKIQPHSFALLMVGQVIAGISSPITLNIMTKVRKKIIGEQRPACSLIIMVAVIASAASIPQIFLPARPKQSPTLQLKDRAEDQPQISLWKATVELMKNIHFWVLCGVHGINVGLSISWGGLFNQAITPYGYSNADAGNMVAVGLVAGTLGCFQRGAYAAILYVNGLNQFFLSFMVPVVVELGVEASYPIPESLSTSILWQLAQVFGFILVLVMDNFRDPAGSPPNNMSRGLIFQAATSGVCVLLAFAYSGPMLRTQAYQERIKEQQQQQHDLENILTPPPKITYDSQTDALPWQSGRPQVRRTDSSTETISAGLANEPKVN